MRKKIESTRRFDTLFSEGDSRIDSGSPTEVSPSAGSRGEYCPECGHARSQTKFCPETGRPHLGSSVSSSSSSPEPSYRGSSSPSGSTPSSVTSTRNISLLISRIPLFGNASRVSGYSDALAEMVKVVELKEKRELFSLGAEGSCMYILLSGRIELLDSHKSRISTVEEGKHFGEIALLYGGKRTASAVALRDCKLAQIDRATLEVVMGNYNCRDDVMKNAQHIPYVKQWFVNNVPLFQTCTSYPDFIERIANSLVYQSVDQGEVIIKQGDIGTEMYFLVSGAADIMDGSRRVKRLDQGAYFGEIAMLFGSERTATIKAVKYSHLYALTKASFDLALDLFPECISEIYGTAQEVRYLKEYFIKKLPLFKSMKTELEFIHNMSDALHSITFQAGSNMVREGDSGTCMYFIARGDANVFKGERQVATLHSGDFFGEVSLLYDEPRSATIKAVQHVHAYRLEQDAFEVIAVAFPRWWDKIKQEGEIFNRVAVTRDQTTTQHHGLDIPSINRGNSIRHVPFETQLITDAERGTAEAREALRHQLQARPRSAGGGDRLVEMENQKLCVVCLTEEKDTLFLPCGHICTCQSCATRLAACPQCRAKVEQKIKVHL